MKVMPSSTSLTATTTNITPSPMESFDPVSLKMPSLLEPYGVRAWPFDSGLVMALAGLGEGCQVPLSMQHL